MVELIKGNPALAAFRAGNAAARARRIDEARAATAEAKRLDTEVASINAAGLDRRLSALARKRGTLTTTPTSASRASTPNTQPIDFDATSEDVAIPSRLPPVKTGATPGFNLNVRGPDRLGGRQAAVDVFKTSPGFAAKGFELQAALDQQKQAREAKQIEAFIALIDNPSVAIAYARSQGQPITPEFARALQNAEFNRILKQEMARAKIAYQGDPRGFNEAMGKVIEQLSRNIQQIGQAHLQQIGEAAQQTSILPASRPVISGLPTPNPAPKFAPKLISVTGADGQGKIMAFDPNTGKISETGVAGTLSTGTARKSVTREKFDLWLRFNPGDTRGALEFAGGLRKIPPVQIRQWALRAAQSDRTNLVEGYDEPGFIDKRMKFYLDVLTAPTAPGSPSGATSGTSPASPTAPQSSAPQAAPEPTGNPPPMSSEQRAKIIGQARSAVAQGAPREAVAQRLRSLGIDPAFLDF